MTETEYLLTCLAEEAAEIIKDVTKSLRFGLEDKGITDPNRLPCRDRLINELNDLIAVADLLVERGVLPEWYDLVKYQAKLDKLKKYEEYSKKVGTLI